MTGPHKPETTDPGVELRVAGIPACAPDVVPPVHAGLTWHGWTLEHDSDLIRAVQKAGGPAATFSVTFDASDGIRLLLEPQQAVALFARHFLRTAGQAVHRF